MVRQCCKSLKKWALKVRNGPTRGERPCATTTREHGLAKQNSAIRSAPPSVPFVGLLTSLPPTSNL
jgi:hypothetical protein